MGEGALVQPLHLRPCFVIGPSKSAKSGDSETSRVIRKVVAFMAGCWLGAWPGEIRSVLKKVCTQRSERECDSYTSASPYVSETGISLTDAYKYYTANREQAKETYFRQASKIIQQHFE